VSEDVRFRSGHAAIVGRPSVGKSTLLNRLVGQRISITSRRPQTTRHRITGIVTLPAAQIAFVDTPGFQTRYASRLNERMNRSVRESLAGVDAVVWVIEATGVTPADRAVLELVPRDLPVVGVLNKVDRLRDKKVLLPRLAEVSTLRDFAALVPVSAENGSGVDALRDEIARCLPASPALYPADDLTDRDERFLASEFVREKAFRLLGDEIPYAVAVGIDAFEQEGDLRRIRATIYVEKASQRAILLGEGGSRIKSIGTEARRDMEALFGGKVFLELWVRVKRGWADSDAMLDRFGY
jgi:GTP-binding protein Era